MRVRVQAKAFIGENNINIVNYVVHCRVFKTNFQKNEWGQ